MMRQPRSEPDSNGWLVALLAVEPARRERVAELFSAAVVLFHQMQSVCDEIECAVFNVSRKDLKGLHPVVYFLPDTEEIIAEIGESSAEAFRFGEILRTLAMNRRGECAEFKAGDWE